MGALLSSPSLIHECVGVSESLDRELREALSSCQQWRTVHDELKTDQEKLKEEHKQLLQEHTQLKEKQKRINKVGFGDSFLE